MQLNARVMPRVSQNIVGRIYHAGAFHRAKIDGRSIVDHFGSSDCPRHDVAYMRPIPYLLTGAPDHVRVLLDERSRNHCDHGMILEAALAVDCKVSAASG